MKKISILFSLLFLVLTSAQSRKGQFRLIKNAASHTLYVCFTESAPTDYKNVLDYNFSKNNSLKAFVESNQLTFTNAIEFSEAKFQEMQKQSKLNHSNSKSVEKLFRIYKVDMPQKDNATLLHLAEEFEKFPEVEYASLMSNTPVQPPFVKINSAKTLTATPNYENNQRYLNPNPGLDVKYAWSIGVTGSGINVKDVEYGMRKSHEMLVNQNFINNESGYNQNELLTNPSSDYYDWADHGTAVASILGSSRDAIGVSGTSYNINNFSCFLEWTTVGYNRVSAVSRAVNSAQAGDIIMYEMQTSGLGGDDEDELVPAEFDNPVWDLTKAATDSGIIVVAAAGNGGVNLDGPNYNSYNARGNSGAIIVGAGSDTTAHTVASFSTYGNRVDVQGWGYNVLAAGYGDYSKIDGDNSRTYTQFSGTSSATPVVTSAVILAQSYYHEKTGNYFLPNQIKDLLKQTGRPQGGDTSKKIGPFPNIKALLEKIKIDYSLAVDSVNPLAVTIYPNPAKDYIQITGNDVNKLDYEIYSTTGQKILEGTVVKNEKINISRLTKGVYFIKATDGKRLVIEKLIK